MQPDSVSKLKQPNPPNQLGGWSPYLQMLLRLVLIAGIICLLVIITSSDRRIIQVYLLDGKIAEIRNSIAEQKQQNDHLNQELDSLRNDLDMIEYIARHDLYLVKENEVLFEFTVQK